MRLELEQLAAVDAQPQPGQRGARGLQRRAGKFFDEMNDGHVHGQLANQKGFQLSFPSVGLGADQSERRRPRRSRVTRPTSPIEDTLTWLKGNHNISWAGRGRSSTSGSKNSTLVPRSASVCSTTIRRNGDHSRGAELPDRRAPSAAQLTAARNLYALLTGRVSQITGDARLERRHRQVRVRRASACSAARMREGGFFVQDSWRLRPNLTLNLGLRYDAPAAVHRAEQQLLDGDDRGRLRRLGRDAATRVCNLFQPGVHAGQGARRSTSSQKGKHAYNTDRNNFAPSVGVAWTPAPRERLPRAR